MKYFLFHNFIFYNNNVSSKGNVLTDMMAAFCSASSGFFSEEDFIVDHPFVFLLVLDKEVDVTVLFVGQVNNL